MKLYNCDGISIRENNSSKIQLQIALNTGYFDSCPYCNKLGVGAERMLKLMF